MRTKETCVVVADAARARFFNHVSASDIDGTAQQFEETNDMVSVTRRHRPSEVETENRPGLGLPGSLLSSHVLDDRRGEHRREVDKRFAAEIADSIVAACSKNKQLILFAAPNLLGLLRVELERHAEFDAETSVIVEQALDLTKLSKTQLHDRLAKDELLPARRVPQAARVR